MVTDCIDCGKYKHGHLEREDLKEKMDRLYQLQSYIGEIMALSTRTKIATFQFVDSKSLLP